MGTFGIIILFVSNAATITGKEFLKKKFIFGVYIFLLCHFIFLVLDLQKKFIIGLFGISDFPHFAQKTITGYYLKCEEEKLGPLICSFMVY